MTKSISLNQKSAITTGEILIQEINKPMQFLTRFMLYRYLREKVGYRKQAQFPPFLKTFLTFEYISKSTTTTGERIKNDF
jgi:hypothetical protein